MLVRMTDADSVLTDDEVRDWIAKHVPVEDFADKRVLLIVPDATRTAPLPLLFEAIHHKLGPVAEQIDVLVALGTPPPMTDDQIGSLMGMSTDDRSGT